MHWQTMFIKTRQYYSSDFFKNSIEGIISQPNPPANRRDNQHQNLPPHHHDRRQDRQERRGGGQDNDHCRSPSLFDDTGWIQCSNIIGIVVLPPLANDRKLCKSCTIIVCTYNNSTNYSGGIHVSFSQRSREDQAIVSCCIIRIYSLSWPLARGN